MVNPDVYGYTKTLIQSEILRGVLLTLNQLMFYQDQAPDPESTLMTGRSQPLSKAPYLLDCKSQIMFFVILFCGLQSRTAYL